MKKNFKLFAFLLIILSQQRLMGQNPIGNFLKKGVKSIQDKLQPQKEVDTITEYNKFNIKTKSDVFTTVKSENIELKIGSQVYMRKNLDVSYYRNGDPIPQVTDLDKWVALTTGAWCYYKNESSYGEVYGKLYNWYAVNDPRGLAPDGYHIPSDAEWTILTDYLGGASVAGDKMKSSKGSNESGFSALLGGFRFLDKSLGSNWFFFAERSAAYFWSSSEDTKYLALGIWLRKDKKNASGYSFEKSYGIYVRCLKD